MNAIKKIENVLETHLLVEELTLTPERGASAAEIHEEEKLLRKDLSPEHKKLLRKWNGIGLEVIRFFGCGAATGEIGRLRDFQVQSDDSTVLTIASDASGFAYLQSVEGEIYSFDTSGGEIRWIAKSLDDLICNVIFGEKAAEFGGADWELEVRENGLI